MSIGHKFSLHHFLFNNWKADTSSKFALTLFFIFVCSVATEWLTYIKQSRKIAAKDCAKRKEAGNDCCKVLDSHLPTHDSQRDGIMSQQNLIDNFLFLVIKFLNYGAMLVAMTYNVWCILVMVLTMPLANFFFSIKLDNNYIGSKLNK